MDKIEIRNLTMSYGKTLALDQVNLKLEGNKIYGLLGRNGAGKTTLLNLMTNKIFPTYGEVFLEGENVLENGVALQKIFYMTEQELYPRNLKIVTIFKWTKEFYPSFDLDYAVKLAKAFELDTKKKVRELSTGYSSIFKGILTLASNADVLLFDEPVLGLDAHHRDLLYGEILAHYIRKPRLIIISTHLIDEVADILEDSIIIEKGKILLQDSVENILASAYSVSGAISAVDQYLVGKNRVSEQVMQGFKSAIVFREERDLALAKSLDLELGQVELQKLFIGLTGSGRVGL